MGVHQDLDDLIQCSELTGIYTIIIGETGSMVSILLEDGMMWTVHRVKYKCSPNMCFQLIPLICSPWCS